MEQEKIENLQTHVIKILFSMINEISRKDVILSLNPDDSVSPDAVSNHHLIENLALLDKNIFCHYCKSLFSWLASDENGYSGHPFTLDSFVNFSNKNDDNRELFSNAIAKKQLKDGAIPIYTAMVQGGDFFSTLWALKILIKYDKDFFKDTIELGIEYLIRKQDISARLLSQKGFLLYILILFNKEKYDETINILLKDILEYLKNHNFDNNIIEVIDELYLLEDLLEFSTNYNYNFIKVIEEKLNTIFNLSAKPELPPIFKKYQDIKPQSTFYQMLLIAARIGIKYLYITSKNSIVYELNSLIQDKYREIKYIGIVYEKALKEYKQQFDDIKNEFVQFDEKLKEMWKRTDSEYDKSIFLMMPFKADYKFRSLTQFIKTSCLELGFKAFRVDDEFRKPFDTLWDNIVLNMLGCRYGISIYISEKSYDQITDELRFFENPNVALEFGFMKSRGKKVLILKDENSKTPSDLEGFKWKPFDLENPDKTIPNVIKEWINEYLLP